MKISLCIICKDEQDKIARCIKSVKEVVDEIIVVDTGSTDGTIAMAERLGSKVIQMAWEDDFSKARNKAIENSKGDWVIFLDADEHFVAESTSVLRDLIKKAEDLKKDCILSEMLDQGKEGIQAIFKAIRIFRRSETIKYEGRVHEKLYNQGGELEGIDFSETLKIYHDGYTQEAMQEKDKIERNIRLLLKEYKVSPASSDICYYLMEAYKGKQDWDKAWEFGMKALEYNNITLQGIKEETYDCLLDLCRILKKEKSITEALYQEALKLSINFPDFDFRYGCYFYEFKEHDKAIKFLERCIGKMEQYKGIAMSKAMTSITLILEILADCYLVEERNQEAVSVLVKILRVSPYEYVVLYHLLKLLETQETGETIGGFLKKFYNFGDQGDLEFILEASKRLGNRNLSEYIASYVKNK